MWAGRRIGCKLLAFSTRGFRTSSGLYSKVAVLGASGGIGQPLSLLLKQSPLISTLHLYDIVHTLGVAKDLSHIETKSEVRGFVGLNQIKECLEGMEIVVIPAGLPRKPGMHRDDLFNTNASIIRDLVSAVGEVCPKALVAIITNPVNSTVPIAAETLKKAGVFDPRRVMGVPTLDSVRTNTFIARKKGLDPKEVSCPVVGGHSGVTIIPLLSQCTPKLTFDQKEVEELTHRIQEAGTEVVKAKAGAGSATLSMAYAGARFTWALLQALRGGANIVESAYVQSDVSEATYFATALQFGPNGVEKNLGLPKMNPFEQELLKKAIPELKRNIKKGEEFVGKTCSKTVPHVLKVLRATG